MRETGAENVAEEILLCGSQGQQKAFADSCFFFSNSGSEIVLLCVKMAVIHSTCTVLLFSSSVFLTFV